MGTNYLLVIAIDQYQNSGFPTLHNAKLDAERFIKVLTEKYNFVLVQDPLFDIQANRKSIIEALNFLSLSIIPDDNIIIYFAGHGAVNSKTKKGYWIPSDASTSVGDYIPNSTVIDTIEGIDAKHILLISDSCFAGTFLTQTRGRINDHYSKLEEKRSRWLFTSGREEIVSDGQPGVGSPFSISLNGFLEENILKAFSVSELFVSVSKATGDISKQQPISAHIENVGHEGGQMVFKLLDHLHEELQDFDVELQRIVITCESALELKRIGFPQISMFGYYSYNKKVVVKRFDGGKNFICSAYIFDEVVEFIPNYIEVDENTYLAGLRTYEKIDKSELESAFAYVSYQKTGVEETPYLSICRYNHKMIAFSITTEGLYNNLICWGKNQAETAALMLIELYNENKVKVN